MKKILSFIVCVGMMLGLSPVYSPVHAEAALESIAIATAPTKTEYAEGDSFDPAGMVVTASYSEGKPAEVKNYTYSPNTALTADVTSIAVSYEGKTAVQPIKVTAPAVLSLNGRMSEDSTSDTITAKLNLSDADYTVEITKIEEENDGDITAACLKETDLTGFTYPATADGTYHFTVTYLIKAGKNIISEGKTAEASIKVSGITEPDDHEIVLLDDDNATITITPENGSSFSSLQGNTMDQSFSIAYTGTDTAPKEYKAAWCTSNGTYEVGSAWPAGELTVSGTTLTMTPAADAVVATYYFKVTSGEHYSSPIVYTINKNPDLTITGGTGYTYTDGVLKINAAGTYEIGMNAGITTTNDYINVAPDSAGEVKITLNGVTINNSANSNPAFIISNTGTTTVTLADGTTNTLTAGNYHAGLENGTSPLVIDGTGTLNATGGNIGAGIGGGYSVGNYHANDGNNITISGGIVTATGGNGSWGGGAGIGGGGKFSGTGGFTGGSGKNININNGTVTAIGGNYAAGIGGGFEAAKSNITLTGGTINAIGDQYYSDSEKHLGAFGNATVSFGETNDTWYQYQTNTSTSAPVSDSIYNYSTIKPIEADASATRNAIQGIHIVANTNASITTTEATYDHAKKQTIATEISHTLGSIKNGDYTLTAGTDYSVYGKKVTINRTYLNGLSVGTATLVFDYGDVPTKPELTITVEQAAIAVTVKLDDWSYGETANTPTLENGSNPGGADVVYTYYTDETLSTKTTETNSGALTTGGKPTKHGTYYVKADVAETTYYKAGTGNKEFVIGKKTIEVTGDGTLAVSKVYDGTSSAGTVKTGSLALSSIVETDKVSVTVTPGDYADVNAGNNKSVTLSLSLAGDDAAKYQLKEDTYVFTHASIAPKEIGITWNNTEFTYNGTEQKPTATAIGLVGTDECTITVTGGETHAGTDYTAMADSLSNSNYKLPTANTQAFTISKKEIGITWSNTGLTYNGSEQKPTATATGLIGTDECTITVIGGKTNAGTGYTATADSLSNSSYKLPAEKTTQFNIKKADISVSVSISGWAYGDTAKDPSITEGSNPGSGSVSYKYYTDSACTEETVSDGERPANAGTYYVKAAVAETGNYNAGSGSTGFTIKKADQSAPSSVIGINGTISGTTSAMEYSPNGTDQWKVCSDGSTSVTDGTWYVRYAEDKNHNAGSAAKVSVVKEETEHTVSGTITSTLGKPSGMIHRDDYVGFIMVVGDSSPYTYVSENVPDGDYEMILTASDGTTPAAVTILVTIKGQNVIQNIAMPSKSDSSLVITEGDNTPNVEAGGLNIISDKLGEQNNKVYIQLFVKENENSVNADEINKAISADPAGMTKGMMLDLDLTKEINDNDPEKITELSVETYGVDTIKVVMHLPSSLQGKDGYALFRYHNGAVDKITETANADGEKIEISADKKTLTAYLKKFSTYAIAYKAEAEKTEDAYESPDTSVKNDAMMGMFALLISCGIAGAYFARRKKHQFEA